MPNVNVVKRELHNALNREFNDEEFEDLCFDFGLEVEFCTTADMMNRAEDSKEEEPVYKIEVPANRYDLLSIEGITQALQAYLEVCKPPTYKITPAETPLKVTV